MAKLIDAVRPEARLILLEPRDQLASVKPAAFWPTSAPRERHA
jgi:hypothetical protein